MSKDRNKDKTLHWKDKSKVQSQELKKLRATSKSLRQSRDSWKAKYKSLKAQSKHLSAKKVKRHSYPMWIIEYSLRLSRYGGSSLRSCQHSLHCLFLVLGLSLKVPSHVSIRNWQHKLGLYRYRASEDGSLGTGGEWSIILDESIKVGTEKLLVILGVDLSDWNFDRSPALRDIRLLYMGCSPSWKAADVAVALEKSTKGLKVVQVVSDGGSNLLAAIVLCSLFQVPDCSHKVAKILQKHLDTDSDFKKLCKLAGELRQLWPVSNYAKWCPPQKRGKSRFLNVFPIFEWAWRVVQAGDKLPAKVREKTKWLFDNKTFVQDVHDISKIVKAVFAILKTQGASLESLKKAKAICSECSTQRVTAICKQIESYLLELEAKVLEKGRTLMCCSDIIESLFGRYKYRTKLNAEVTDSALMIPFLSGDIDTLEIEQALETVYIDEIQDWKKEKFEHRKYRDF